MAWMDQKLVFALSTHIPRGLTQVTRHTKTSETGSIETAIPTVIDIYNKYMGGVDRYDQKLKNHAYSHRNSKWPQVVWHFCRQVVLTNAYIMFCTAFPDTSIESKDFKLSIAYSLLTSSVTTRQTGQKRCFDARLVKIVGNKRIRKDCVLCRDRKNVRKQVSFCCPQCALPLCANSDS